jgi:hypothetical protein
MKPAAPPTAAVEKATCARCGQPFTPVPTGLRVIPMTECCDTCLVRNLFDGFDLPTPPKFLDVHTKHPTLTEAEWHQRMKEDEEKNP